MLHGKKFLLCVTGGIAVYKAAILTSKLTQKGAKVKVIMTDGATKFVTPLTFQSLSRNEVYWDTFDEKDPNHIAHIDLADWADIVIVAPATANTISKLANGIADNMVTTTILATTAPVWIAPAMNVHMYEHPAVKNNMNILKEFGYHFIEPGEGYLACGYVGKGRLEEPENIIHRLETYYRKHKSLLHGKNVLITAGPTREKIDPIRFISNHSSGKMGYALAEVAKSLGANVTLISGPVNVTPPIGVHCIYVESAEEMYQAVVGEFANSDIVIKAAAVSDYRPKYVYDKKIKKKPGEEVLELERTKDILLHLGKQKSKQVLVGFAAETNHVEEYALKKLKEKNADLIVANNVTEKGAGFGTDTNIITIFNKKGEVIELPLMTKKEAAEKILLEAAKFLPGGIKNDC